MCIRDSGLRDFDICIEQPVLWHYIKIAFIISYVGSSIFIFNSIYSILFSIYNKIAPKKDKFKINKHKTTHRHSFLPSLIEKKSFNLNLLIGLDENGQKITLNEKSLYQNILITGTIGTGKTSSAMYPFTKQLISYNSDDITAKIGMLILDVDVYKRQCMYFCRVFIYISIFWFFIYFIFYFF